MCNKILFAIFIFPLFLSAQIELIQNGNFNIPNGSSGAAWVIDNSQGSGYFNFGTTTANMYNSASGYAYSASSVPGPQANMYQYLEQKNITVPVSATSATFSFYTSAFVQSPATGNEKLFAYIYDVTLNQITTCTSTIVFSSGASSGNANGYSLYSLNLPSSYFGHNLTVGFRAQSGSAPATIRVDDVSLTYIAPTCTPPSTPISFTATPNVITAGQPTTLTINGGSLGSNAPYWQIFANNNCTGTPVDFTTGNSTTIYPSSTTSYYVNATGCGTSTNCLSTTVTVNTSCTAPTISSQPSINSTTTGNSTSCSVSVNGSPSSFTYNWQVNTGGGWTSLSNTGNTTWNIGGSSSTLTLSNTTITMNGYQYKCIVSNGCTPDAISSSTTLNVTNICTQISNVSITGDQTVTAPAQATFTATASGTSPQYQWQYSTDNGNNYNNLSASSQYSGITSNQLVINPTSQLQTSTYYRCQITNACTSTPQYTQGRFLTVYTTLPNPIVTVSQPQTGSNITLYTSTNLVAYLNVVCDSVQFSVSYNGQSGSYNYISTFFGAGTSAFKNWTPSYITSSNCILRARAFKNGVGYDGYSGVFNIIGQSPIPFQLNPNGVSHLYWPFVNSNWHVYKNSAIRNGWKRIGEEIGYEFGVGGHLYSDYYAQDWNKYSDTLPNSSDLSDCGEVFTSPLVGKIIGLKTNEPCSFSCCLSTPLSGHSSNHVFIQSSIDTNFVFGILHLKSGNPFNLSIGQSVSVGTQIGIIGSSNTNSAHAHCVFYKKLNQINHPSYSNSTLISILSNQNVDGLAAALPWDNSSPSHHAANFLFDATFGGTGGSQPVDLIQISGSTSLCNNSTLTLTAHVGQSYYWSTGDTTQSITVNTSGIYSVLVTDFQNSQLISEEITVTNDTSFALEIVPENPVLCSGNHLTLSAGEMQNGQVNVFNFALPNQFTWSNGSTNYFTTITQPGVYYLTYTDGKCIHAVDSITISSFPPPQQPTISKLGNTNILASSFCNCTYVWLLNGNIVGTGQQINCDTIGSGFYSVQVKDQNGCTNQSNPFGITTDILNIDNTNILIYPNPANNLLNIKLLDNIEKGKYEIHNSLGQKIIEGDLVNSNTNSVDISRLATGVYFIQLTNGLSKSNYRFFKE